MSAEPRRRWRLFALFCALALGLLALVPLLSALFGLSMDFAAVAARASEQTGVEWTSSLWNVVQLSLAEPGLWLLVLGSFVPTLAALVTLSLARDRGLWSDLRVRLHPLGRRGEPVGRALLTYALLVVGIVVCLVVAFALRNWLDPGAYARSVDPLSSSLVGAIAMAALLDQGALLEEGGWRGFATPLLQDRVATPLGAAVVVGVAWGLWHVPRDVVGGVIERLGAIEYALLFLPAFVLGCVTSSILASYFMNRIGGSLLPAIMVHGLANDAMGISGTAAMERVLTPFHQLTKVLPFVLLCLVVLWLGGRRLGLPASLQRNA